MEDGGWMVGRWWMSMLRGGWSAADRWMSWRAAGGWAYSLDTQGGDHPSPMLLAFIEALSRQRLCAYFFFQE